MRFHLRELLTVVAVSGLVCAAFVRGGPLWETIVFSGTLLLVLVAILLAIGRTTATRWYWLGLAVATGSYLAFAHMADEHNCVPRRDGPEVTTQLIFWAVLGANPDLDADEVRNPGQVGQFGRGSGPFSVQDSVALGEPRSTASDLFGDDSIPGIGEVTRAAAELDRLGPWQGPVPSSGNLTILLSAGPRGGASKDLTPQFRIGHCAWALLFGWLAAHLVQSAHRVGASNDAANRGHSCDSISASS